MKTVNRQAPKTRRILGRKLEKHRQLHKFSTSLYLKYCSLTGFLHVLPDFLIIGFVKCGTTSLYEYLLQHPYVYPPAGKEIDYFDRLYAKGINWYKVNFPLKLHKTIVKNLFRKDFVTGEATPRYIEHPYALDRIKKIVPNAKFIILLRNPIDRAFSQYNQNLNNGYEYLSFEDAIKLEKERIRERYEKMQSDETYYSWDYDLFAYLEHGVYVNKIIRWMNVFPKDQFLILHSEEFLKNTSVVYHRVLNFLNLPKWEPIEYSLFKKQTYQKPRIDPALRKQLVEYFKPHNERLYKLLGTDFHWEN